jgi:hypothetical protein
MKSDLKLDFPADVRPDFLVEIVANEMIENK